MDNQTVTLQNYQQFALRTEKPLPLPADRLAHAALGFVTEIGEITTEVKRMVIYGKPLDDERRANIAEEIGDVMWYLAIAGDVLEYSVFLTPRLTDIGNRNMRDTALKLAWKSGQFIYIMADNGVDAADLTYAMANMWRQLQRLALMVDVPIEKIAADNIAKLQARYPDKYSDLAAEARADKEGLDARNS